MADWPDVDELKKRTDLDADGGDDWTTTLERVLASAIAFVKEDVGDWNEDTDEPTDNQAQAALHLAEEMAPAGPGAVPQKDRTYNRLMYGQHRRFGIS